MTDLLLTDVEVMRVLATGGSTMDLSRAIAQAQLAKSQAHYEQELAEARQDEREKVLKELGEWLCERWSTDNCGHAHVTSVDISVFKAGRAPWEK